VRLPWHKRKDPDVIQRTPARLDPLDALKRSQAALRAAQEQGPAVREVASSLRRRREENHFSEMIAESFRERT
jgi:hypothetical protein